MTGDTKSNFPKALKYYMSVNNKKQQDLIEELNISSATISQWVNGKALPRMDRIELLAKYFGVSTSEMLSDPYNKPAPTPPQKDNTDNPFVITKMLNSSPSLRELMHLALLLHEEDVAVLKAVAERLHTIQKDK